MKHTFSIAGIAKKYIYVSNQTELYPPAKKVARWDIASRFSHDLFPIHAVIVVKNNRGILICGASGSGKTTLAKALENEGYKKVANDFVGVWSKSNKLYAGALDFYSNNSKRNAIEICNCYFLSPEDKRDIFIPNKQDFKNLYTKAMFPWKHYECEKFIKSEIFNKLFTKTICLGNRVNINRTVNNLFQTLHTKNIQTIGIIGVGTLGQDICNLLMLDNNISALNLYSRNINKTKSIALDLNTTNSEVKAYTCQSALECISKSDLIILSYRDTSLKPSANRLIENSAIMWDLSRDFRKSKFSGIVLVLTNPVDTLCVKLYDYTNHKDRKVLDAKGLGTHQIFGLGIGLDYSRLKTLTKLPLEVLGEHNGELVLVNISNGIAKIVTNKPLLKKLRLYSKTIRQHTPRTRFGPSHETLKVINSFINNKTNKVRASVFTKDGVFTGQILELDLGLPRYLLV